MFGLLSYPRAILICTVFSLLGQIVKADLTMGGGNVSIQSVAAEAVGESGQTVPLVFTSNVTPGPGGNIVSALTDGDLCSYLQWDASFESEPFVFEFISVTFIFTLAQDYDISRVLVWNDSDASPGNNGVREFSLSDGVLEFSLPPLDPADNSTVVNPVSLELIDVMNAVTTAQSVREIRLTVENIFADELIETPPALVELREIGFMGTPVPEPSHLVVFVAMSIGCAGSEWLRKKRSR